MALRFPPSLPNHRRFDVIGFGLNAVDHLITVPHYPAFNSKVRFLDHQISPGGQVATAMVGLSRLGMKTRYIGQVGDDEAGKVQIHSLSSEGVDTSLLQTVYGAKSQIAFILVERTSGERTIVWDRDDRLDFDPDASSGEMIQCGRILHLDGHDVPASIRAAQLAHEADMTVVIDVDNVYPHIEELLPLVTCLTTSADFPRRITGEADLANALRLMQRRFGSPLVVVTLGQEGALALFDNQWIESPGFAIECRDTTGAGDAFRVGFIYGLLLGLGLGETLRVANAVGALNCRALGARGGLPNRTQLEAFLKNPSRC